MVVCATQKSMGGNRRVKFDVYETNWIELKLTVYDSRAWDEIDTISVFLAFTLLVLTASAEYVCTLSLCVHLLLLHFCSFSTIFRFCSYCVFFSFVPLSFSRLRKRFSFVRTFVEHTHTHKLNTNQAFIQPAHTTSSVDREYPKEQTKRSVAEQCVNSTDTHAEHAHGVSNSVF